MNIIIILVINDPKKVQPQLGLKLDNADDCPDMKFHGGPSALHFADEEARHAKHTLKRKPNIANS